MAYYKNNDQCLKTTDFFIKGDAKDDSKRMRQVNKRGFLQVY